MCTSFEDSGKLPYMATLRNLRNLLLVGIDEAHMEKVFRKLTTEVSHFLLMQ